MLEIAGIFPAISINYSNYLQPVSNSLHFISSYLQLSPVISSRTPFLVTWQIITQQQAVSHGSGRNKILQAQSLSNYHLVML